MADVLKIKQELIALIDAMEANDLSDIGNDIVVLLAKYIKDDDEKHLFISGIMHGLSIIDGSH